MPPTLLLIDALNLIRRIHGAIPAQVSAAAENQQIDATLTATVSSIQRALRESDPSHLLIVFDGDPPTWRHQLYPEYKARRHPMPALLRKRLVEFNTAFRTMGLMTFRRNGTEADDVIGAVTHKAIAAKINTVILSTDRAYRQLLHSPLVSQRDHFTKTSYNGDSVKTEFGLSPQQLLDYWSIAGVGDIPGVPGVGKKGATELLNRFGNLQGVLAQPHGEAKGALKKVLAHKAQAQLSMQLATLQQELELGLSLKDLRYQPRSTSQSTAQF